MNKNPDPETLEIPLQELSYHENLLHICRDIERNQSSGATKNGEPVTPDIHVDRMLLSKCAPKITLSKYLSSTLDKHNKDAESYEREACFILLQIFKGLEHLSKRGYCITDIDCDSVLLADVRRGVLTSSGVNNNNSEEQRSCPTALCLALPGLLTKLEEVKSHSSTEVKDRLSSTEVKSHLSAGVKDRLSSTEVKSHSSAEVEGLVSTEVRDRLSSTEVKSQLSNEVKAQFPEVESNDLVAEVKGHSSAEVKDDLSAEDGKGHSLDKVNKAIENYGDNNLEKEGELKPNRPVYMKHLSKDFLKNISVLVQQLFHCSEDEDVTFDSYQGQSPNYPTLPAKSIYSRRLQLLVKRLLTSDNLDLGYLVKLMEVVIFCPVQVDHISEEHVAVLLQKWRNRRCVDIVTDILRKYSLISLANGLAFGGKDKKGLSRDTVLECQFLAHANMAEMENILRTLGA